MKKILSIVLSLVLVIGIMPQISPQAKALAGELKSSGELPANIDTDFVPVALDKRTDNAIIDPTGWGQTGGLGFAETSADNTIVYTITKSAATCQWEDSATAKWGAEGIQMDKNKIDTSIYKAGATLVFSAQVKSHNSNNPKLTWGLYQHTKKSILPMEYPTRAEGMESATTYKTFGATIKIPEVCDVLGNTAFTFGFAKMDAPESSNYAVNIMQNSMYLAIEAASDINVTADKTIVVKGEKSVINVDADVMNQVNSKGTLDQTFTWHALNKERTEYADGITVANGDDGRATVTVSENVPVGTYVLVAVSDKYDEIIKGLEISVGYEDYIPGEMPKNYLAEGATAADLLSMNYNHHFKYGSGYSGYTENPDVMVTENSDGSVTLTAKRALDDPHAVYEDTDGDGKMDKISETETNTAWAFSGALASKSVLNLPAQRGSLVYAFKVSNNSSGWSQKSVSVNFGRNTSPLYPVEYDGKDKGMSVLSSGGKWQVFCGTIPDDGVNNLNSCTYSIGLPKGTVSGATAIIKADEMYFGIEEAYDIENKIIGEDSVTVGVGGKILVDADIVNQIYLTGSLEQGEFAWTALNSDRTEVVEGITITAGADGSATVNVSADVPAGVYDIVASSKKYDGFIKGVKIYVVLPEDSEAEGLAQHIALDFENGAAGCTAQGSETAVNSGALSVNVTSPGGMALFPIRTEAGNRYSISAWVRADGEINTQNGYFVFANKAIDGGSDVINEVPVKHTVSFANGEWVYVTAEYTADGRGMRGAQKVGAMLSGTVGFRFGSDSAVSYSIDDFFVIPYVDNKVNYNEVLKEGSFDTDDCLDYWTVWANEGGTLSTEQKKNNGFTYDGYKNKPGALELDCIRTYDAIRPKSKIEIEYGRKYKFSFVAKAMDDEAVGQPIWFYLSFGDEKGDGYDPVFSKAYHLNNPLNPKLTKEWQYYEIDFDYDFVARNLAEITTLGFRVSDTYNRFIMDGGRPHYMVDNVSLRQIGGEDFVVDAKVFGDVSTGATIKFNYVESTKGKFLYRIVRETPEGEYCVKTDFIDSEVIDFSYTDDLGNDKLRLDLIGTDAYGNYSQVYSMPIEVAKKENKVSFMPDEYFWDDDTETLSATLTYESTKDLDKLNVYAALYDKNDKFITLSGAVLIPESGAEKQVSVYVNATADAVKAKFFAWYEGTNTPCCYADEMYKSAGEFIYVDANNIVDGNGSKETPFNNISSAVSALEELAATTDEENIYVVLKSGEYLQTEAIDLSDAASKSDKNIIFTTDGGKKATISGASRVTGFEEYENGIYRAKVPAGTNSRQLYVNGIKATRARTKEDVAGFTNLDAKSFANNGLSCTDTSYASYKYPTELELVFIENWCHYYIMPDSISVTDGVAYFTFTENGNADMWEKLMTERVLPASVPVYLENALELLDEEGEWYLDTCENYLYYMPRSFENINTAEVILPAAEQLVVAEGTADSPVKNLRFENIDFEYTTWNYPTENRGFEPTQALYYHNQRESIWDSGDEIVDGALQFKNVHNLTFDNCDFAHLGSNALVMLGAVQNCNIAGNEFYEISGNAINLGEVEGDNVKAPRDEKYFVTGNVISDNYIHKIADDYYSGAGIVAGYPKNTVIRNNEIADMPYCGIHAGWGWASMESGGIENLVIENNYIHDTMNNRLYDGAPIYVVGKTNGTTQNPNLIRGNYIKDTKNPVAGIYPDDGSNYWKIYDNVIDASRYSPHYYLKESQRGYASWLNVWVSRVVGIVTENNYSTTTHYTYAGAAGSFEQAEIYPNGDWCDEAVDIIDNAGISREYQDRFCFDIQTLTIPGWMTMTSGATEKIYYDARTSKDKICNLSECEIVAKSSDESVVTVTDDTITAVASGKAWVTFIVYRKDLSFYDEYRLCVMVN